MLALAYLVYYSSMFGESGARLPLARGGVVRFGGQALDGPIIVHELGNHQGALDPRKGESRRFIPARQVVALGALEVMLRSFHQGRTLAQSGGLQQYLNG